MSCSEAIVSDSAIDLADVSDPVLWDCAVSDADIGHVAGVADAATFACVVDDIYCDELGP